MTSLLLLMAAGPAWAQDEAPPPAAPEDEAPAPAVPAPTPPPASWVSRDTADLVLLDKISARASPLSLHAGSTVRFGTLSITLRACDIRPPDQRADSAAWLDIADDTAPAVTFHAWMLANEPSLSSLESPSYDVRLTRCR